MPENGGPIVRFSVVTPVYNVARYLDEFLASITSEPLFSEAAEIVAVNDGSTDDSAAVLERWRARFPDRIRIVQRENGGLCVARNSGLPFVRGDWVTFMDPDNFVDSGYFAAVDAAIARNAGSDVALLAIKAIYYYDSDRSKRDTHPLRFRFDAGERAIQIADLGKAIHNGVVSSFFRRDLLEETGLRFDPLVKPGFEDGHFLGRYMNRFHEKAIVFVPAARYFYRKRGDKTSLSDSFASHPGRYTTQLRYGQLGLLKDVATSGPVPPFIQNMILYSLRYIVGRIIPDPGRVAFLSEAERQECIALITEIVGYLDTDVIAGFDLVDANIPYRVGLLGAFKGVDMPVGLAEIGAISPDRRTISLVTWSRLADPALTFSVDGVPMTPVRRQSGRVMFFDRLFAWEHATWLAIADGEQLRAFMDGKELVVRVGGRRFASGLPLAAVRRHAADAVKPTAR